MRLSATVLTLPAVQTPCTQANQAEDDSLCPSAWTVLDGAAFMEVLAP